MFTQSTFSDNRAGEGKSGAKMGHGGAIYCDDTATINIDVSFATMRCVCVADLIEVTL